MDWLDAIQWPAMAVTVAAAWLVASSSKKKRNAGFWIFLLSNVLWVVWGMHTHAYALITLQIALAALNIRGTLKTRREARAKAAGNADTTGTAGSPGPSPEAGGH
ncbi:MAG: hypothetical protein V4731_17990 [Pseudomonadota bacterium]